MAVTTGTSGKDYIQGTEGDDTISGGEGDDVIFADGGADKVKGDGGNDYIVGGVGDDDLDGGDGDDEIFGLEGNDIIAGGAGIDKLHGRQGNDVISGGAGADEINGDGFVSSVDDGADQLSGGEGDDRISGHGADDTLYGDGGNDTLRGGHGSDILDGGDGDDRLSGYGEESYGVDSNIDTLSGGAGNDWLTVGYGDSADGGVGSDTIYLDLYNGSAGVSADLRQLANNGSIQIGGGTITNVELVAGISLTAFDDVIVAGPIAPGVVGISISGWGGNDHLTESAGTDTIYGGDGDDVIIGGTGYNAAVYPSTDRLMGENGNDTIYVRDDGALVSGGSGDDTVYGGAGADEISGDSGQDQLFGGGGNDGISGGDGDDRIEGGDGNDTILGGDGNDLILEGQGGNDIISGGAGNDEIWVGSSYSTPVFTVTVDGNDGNDTINVQGVNGVVRGGAGTDVIRAGFGTLSINGGDGDDQLIVAGPSWSINDGAQTLTGGAGADLFAFGPSSRNGQRDVITDFNAAEGDRISLSAGDGRTGIYWEQRDLPLFFAGTLANASLSYGQALPAIDPISATKIAQVFQIYSGGNTYLVVDANGDNVFTENDLVIELRGTINLTVASFEAGTFRSIIGTAGNDVLTGTDSSDPLYGKDHIYGLSGDDTLRGLGGFDYIVGGEGNDLIEGGAFSDTLFGGDGNDTIYAGTGGGGIGRGDVVDAGDGDDTVYLDESIWGGTPEVYAGAGNDTVSGGDFIDGWDGDDYLDGLGGLNRISGGRGNDILITRGGGESTLRGDDDDDIILAGLGNDQIDGGNGIDWLEYSLMAAGVNVTLANNAGYQPTEGAGRDSITRIENLAGTAHNDNLTGDGGDNVIIGGGGNDTIDGGAGTDTVSYRNGHLLIGAVSGITLSLAVAGAQDTGGAGIDTILNIENVEGSSHIDTLTGNASANMLFGLGGNDVLSGGGSNDFLDGGAGADIMTGGADDDIYIVDDVNDIVTENAGGGIDEVRTTLAVYALAANVERGVYIGTGTGSITANAGDNYLGGGGLNDSFNLSQGGNDTAVGGDGNDAFFFGSALTAADTVDGGAGTNDQLGLQGDYTGANALTLGANTISGIELIGLLGGAGNGYAITTVDANVATGTVLTLFGTNLAAGNAFTFDGSAETDGSFRIYGGAGTDNLTGGSQNDGFWFGPGRFNPAVDRVNGGGGTNDQLALDGNYTLTLDGVAVQGIETITLQRGPVGDYNKFNLTVTDTMIADGGRLTIWGLPVVTNVVIDATAETDGDIWVFGGQIGDSIYTGAGNDRLFGGGGGDTLYGGAGNDTYVYDAVSQSTGINCDGIQLLAGDKIDFNFTVGGIAATVVGGTLGGDFDADLTAAIGAGQLGVGEAVLFRPDAGAYAGNSFLVVDANGVAGYQAGQDYVIQLIGNPSTLPPDPFI